MTVAELIKRLQELPQDVDVVKPGEDHSYVKLYTFYEAKAEYTKGDIIEYYDEPMFGGIVKTVVVLE